MKYHFMILSFVFLLFMVASSIYIIGIENSVSDTLSEGETRTYTLNGASYEVTLDFAGQTQAIFSVNGVSTGALSEGQSHSFSDGSVFELVDIIEQNFGGGARKGTFKLTANGGGGGTDNTPPYVAITYPINGSWLNTNYSWLNVTTSENAVCEYYEFVCVTGPNKGGCFGDYPPGTVTKNMSVTGGTLHSEFVSGLNYTNGSNEFHQLQVTCVDSANNSNQTLLKFFVDTILPEFLSISVHPRFLNKGKNLTILVSVNGTLTNITSVAWNIFNTTFISNQSMLIKKSSDWFATQNIGNISDGLYNINITAIDFAGNSATKVIDFIVSSLVLQFNNSLPLNLTSNGSLLVFANFSSGSGFPPNATCMFCASLYGSCRTGLLSTNVTTVLSNDLLSGNCSYLWNMTGLQDGEYYIRSTIIGNSYTTAISTQIIIDMSAPAVGYALPENAAVFMANLTNGSLQVNFRYLAGDVSPIANCSLFLDGSLNMINKSVERGIYSFFLVNLSTENAGIKNHSWSVRCTDVFGFENSTLERSFIMNVLDIVPPVISINSSLPLNLTSNISLFVFANFSDVGLGFSANISCRFCKLFSNPCEDYGMWSSENVSTSISKNFLNGNCSYVWNVSGARGGSYDIAFKIEDASLNRASSNRQIIIDMSAPAIGSLYPYDNGAFTVNSTSQSQVDPTNTSLEVKFWYLVSDFSPIANCSLFLNGRLNTTHWSVEKYLNRYFLVNLSSVISGTRYYNWSVSCADIYGFQNTTLTNKFTILVLGNFSGGTTDFGAVNLSRIENLTFEKIDSGKIKYSEAVDLGGVSALDMYVKISHNKVEINSTAIPALNKTATIHLYNLFYEDPMPFKDSSPCPPPACNEISYINSEFVFNVTQFSIYYAQESPASNEGGVSSGSGGGGGGGGSGGNGGAIAVSESSFVQSVSAGSSGKFDFRKYPELGISGITVSINQQVFNPRIDIREAKLAEGMPFPDGSTYKLISINKFNLDDSQISSAVIEFKVPNSWMAGNNINPESIAISRLRGASWNKVETVKKGSDSEYSIFEAQVSGFSIFAITGLENIKKEEIKITETKQEERLNETKELVSPLQESLTSSSYEQLKTPDNLITGAAASGGNNSKIKTGGIAIMLAIVIIGTVSYFAVFRKRNKFI